MMMMMMMMMMMVGQEDVGDEKTGINGDRDRAECNHFILVRVSLFMY